jgi:hypothetical protein
MQALSPDLSDCRNKGLRDIGLINTRWYLFRNEEVGIVIVGNHAGRTMPTGRARYKALDGMLFGFMT